eukprot:CAMPEP_0174237066 /NCGR_PEP_ID=MMETSP0417-20130205/6742_1 /TAXON_ID=242541 /ORGANISM="Mayorella sp, Strain BSH-02190019" /LENGTH=139 /DNA_ID=CAMNT_0015315785 /DNA_START=54 /DNA_END=469 /DNA_ORIENTATION=+
MSKVLDDRQDWKPVIIGKKKGASRGGGRPPAAAGVGVPGAVAVSKGAGNRQRAGPDNYRALDSDEAGPVKTVELSLSRKIQQARQDKKMTQKELATMVNEQQRVIQDYESGRAVPNNQVLGKLERALGVKLRGKAARAA